MIRRGSRLSIARREDIRQDQTRRRAFRSVGFGSTVANQRYGSNLAADRLLGEGENDQQICPARKLGSILRLE